MSFLLLATPHPSAPANLKMNRNVGYSYPALPPGYQNTSPPGAPGMQASALQYPDGSKHFHQVKFLLCLFHITKPVHLNKEKCSSLCCLCGVMVHCLLCSLLKIIDVARTFCFFLSLWKQSVKMVPALSEVSSEICLEHQSSKIICFLKQAYRMIFIPHVSIASWSMCFSCAFKPIWPIFLPARPLHFKSFVACVW